MKRTCSSSVNRPSFQAISSLFRLSGQFLSLFVRFLAGDRQVRHRINFLVLNWPLSLYFKFPFHASERKRLISVITPTTGRLDYLQQAVHSVDQQSSSNWEHLVVWDGYSQSFSELSQQNSDRRRRFYWTLPTHNYGNLQRNLAICFARGEYLLFLDDDNILYPEALRAIDSAIASNEAFDWFLFPIDFDSDRHDIHCVLVPSPPLQCGEIDSLNLVVRRSVVMRCRGWTNSYTADFALIQRIVESSPGKILTAPKIGHHR